MITTPSTEPTLTDVIEKLDSLSTRVDTISTGVENLSTRVDNISTRVDHLATSVARWSTIDFPTTSKRLSGLCSLLLL